MQYLRSVWLFFIISIACLFPFIGSAVETHVATSKPSIKMEEGVMDLALWHSLELHKVKLSGDWGMLWGQLVTPNLWQSPQAPWFQMPSTWDQYGINDYAFSGQGAATFTAILKNIPEHTRWSIIVPEQSTAFRLFVNERIVLEGGRVGASKSTSEPYSNNRIVDLGELPSEIKLTFQVSNHHHASGGPWQSLIFGEEQELNKEFYLSTLYVSVVGLLAIILAGYLFLHQLIDRTQRASLYLGLFSCVIALRLTMAGNAPLYWLLGEIPWELHIRLMYLTMLLALPIIFVWLRVIFPDEVKDHHVRLIWIVFLVPIFVVLFTGTLWFTGALMPMQFMILFGIVAFVYFWLKALWSGRAGSWIFLIGLVTFVPTAIHDMLMYMQYIAPTMEWMPVGLLFFILSQVANLLVMRSRHEVQIRSLSQQLVQANKLLEQRVEERTFELEEKALALEKVNDKLKILANIDDLTGVLNRRAFFEQLNHLSVAEMKSAVLMLDVDFFKQVNDTYGHAVGDEVLRRLGELLSSLLREVDQIGRLGGEEFGILLYGCDKEGAESFCRRIIAEVQQLNISDLPLEQPLTMSIGGAIGALKKESIDNMMQHADEGLYQVKDSGRNNFRVQMIHD